MSIWAKPGVKCVCVDAAFVSGRSPLTEGQVYVIAKVVIARPALVGKHRAPGIALVLEGVENPYAIGTNGFAIHRFRPLITRTQEQDVALFRSLLTGLTVQEPV